MIFRNRKSGFDELNHPSIVDNCRKCQNGLLNEAMFNNILRILGEAFKWDKCKNRVNRSILSSVKL